MKPFFFNEKMKLANLILTNYKLLFVFPRFGIDFELGDQTVEQMCRKKNISIRLFLLVCNIYSFDNYPPQAGVLDEAALSDLIRYLRNSHRDYLRIRVPKVIADTLRITKSCYGKQFEMFCRKYQSEIELHFAYEDRVVFPYVESLLNKQPQCSSFRISEYKENHGNIQGSLNDLKSLLIKYVHIGKNSEKKRKALINLFLLEDDLKRHALLEDCILVTSVAQLERELKVKS